MLEGFTPWPEDFVERYKKKGYWKDQTIGQVLHLAFERYSGSEAIVCENQRVTYKELAEKTRRLALHFVDLGLKPHDRLILQIHNIPEAVYVYIASVTVGVIPVMVLPPYREAEIGYFAELTGAKAYAIPALLRGFDYQQMARELVDKIPSLKTVFVVGEGVHEEFHSIDTLLTDRIEERVPISTLEHYRPDPMEPAILQLSGGTTGIPKLIPRTHNDYVYNFTRSATVCDLDDSTRMVLATPITHNFTLASTGLQGTLVKGGTAIISTSTRPEDLLSLIERERATHITAVPAIIMGLLNSPDLNSRNISSLRVIHSGGSKLNAEVKRRIVQELKCDFQEVLGNAEGLLSWTRLDDLEEIRLHTQGRPMSPDDEVKVVDDNGKEVALGQIGELFTRGPYTVRGYYKAPEHNEKAFTNDGFYKTGDLVRIHPCGSLIVEGRKKDVICRGGEKISAEEVENHILAHPKVANCAAVGMPDPILEERTCCFVVVKLGEGTLSLDELANFLVHERRIAKFKLPERLEIIEALPLTKVGKVDKNALREIIKGKLAQEGKLEQ
jgi:2,3-dihydroxybenzoate-AMP ligase